MRKLLLVAGAAALGSISGPAWADFSYPNFSDTTGLQLNGNASTAGTGSGTVLRVTPATTGQSGSVFSSTPITLSDAYSFSTRFTFNFNSQGDSGGADGLVFVVQTNSSTFGGSGGGIGYFGLPNSLGVEFDNWYNSEISDLNDNHVGIDIGGNIVSVQQVPSPFVLDSGTNLTAWIDYNSGSQLLEVFLSDGNTRPGSPIISYNVDLQSVLGVGNQAFVGFTSGTGAAWANHDVLNWDFIDHFAPVGVAVPEPATWAMMLCGFGGIGFAMRRQKRKAVAGATA